ncbi:MAG TPA: DUF350 domain-containing protein [Gordonia sp. (in: high G+C Gram-positive bacteria)]|uniref:DUF350 domain-containing protein n=1 Tax=unclassified Gordonia (in: high G+C Gram-positive bacteria) TaxID=2657482 RepID=UPI000FBDFA54|nr:MULTISPECIES: DUF350 domain-containing protein [unclassified Gordonia (in: high G+C Gram-positive bacteria)]RUP37778.1 MAG: DUF350 domain-containing protein [Gordonia sp. (in: high G+C Gram-positive bacteria)]HNP55372.1 DUF350 domain-containing protein [Gordonia sp. (in: high G+C Gram-positive bacteria)]HRC50056.1 DUF350 domain-containing protein [Gordonia sp. (in: high G+C Gram-positive bacteria)]
MDEKFWDDLIAAGAYSVAGIVAMAVGFIVLDLLTPGNLRAQVWSDRNRNAAALVASNLIGMVIVVVAAIAASEGGLARGMLYTAAYSALGLVAMAVTFGLLTLVTPGKIGDAIMDEQPHPAVAVHAVLHIAAACIIAAAIL